MTNLDDKLDDLFEEGINKNIFKKQFEQDKKFLNEFCSKYNLYLTKLTTTDESGKLENMYFFNDNLGGYTLDGIKKSLDLSLIYPFLN